MLIECRDGKPRSEPQRAGIRRQCARQHVDQRGLAAAVRPDHAHPLARSEPPCHVVEQDAAVRRRRHVLRLQHGLAQPGGRQPGQLDAVTRRRLVSDQLVGRLDAEFRLAGPGGRPAPQPGQLLAQHPAPTALRHVRDPRPLSPRQHVGGITAVIGMQLAVGKFPGPVARHVEEPAVVGDRHERAAQVAQVPGQPVDRLDIQVVRRLVQQQQVMVTDQYGRQRHPPGLAAGEPLRWRIQVYAGQ